MKTVLKFAIYVEIDSENIDRKIITEGASQVLFPSISRLLAKAYFTKETEEEFRRVTKARIDTIKVLTEFDLFKDRN